MKLAITPGDPAGIGPELVDRIFAHPPPRGVELVRVADDFQCEPGRPTLEGARAALNALERAAKGCLSGEFSGVVTGPVSKEQLAAVGFPFPGQTEFFAARAGLSPEGVTMAMIGRKLRVFLVTTHLPLRRAIDDSMNAERLLRTVRHARAFVGRDGPLAVAALNPHAGEGGLLGREEIEILEPLLRSIRAELGEALPLVSADTVFYQATQGRFAGVICLFHDQGLIPFKLICFRDGVNCTLGLPFVRTSPDHGTAFDLAGTGRADMSSFRAAVALAARLIRRSDGKLGKKRRARSE